MKPTTLLLAASLLANLALLGWVALRSPSVPAASARPASAAASGPSGTAARGERDTALRSALASGNAQALEAAGLDPVLARELALGRNFSRLVAKARAEKAATGDGRWWRNAPMNAEAREKQLLLQREVSDALVAAFGDDAGLFSLGNAAKLSFLPPDKREALRRITQDYDEMMDKFSAGGVQLASDRERLKLLRRERERDIAALLTPEERNAYEMRTSHSAMLVRARYGDGLETEEDFRKVYALQKAFDDKFPMDSVNRRTNPEGMKAFNEAQRQLNDDIRSALGESTYGNLRRATDGDLRTVDSLVSRLSLPPATTDRVAATRENFAAESQRISADASLTPTQRRTQLQELGNRARAEVQQALGAEGTEAYAQRSPWLSMLQGGLAYSTTPLPGSPAAALPGNQSVFPVMPAVPPGSSATRQVIISNPATSSDSGVGHDVILGGGGPVVRDNVQVMTFTTATPEGTKPAPDGSTPPGTRTLIVAPPATPPPPPR